MLDIRVDPLLAFAFIALVAIAGMVAGGL